LQKFEAGGCGLIFGVATPRDVGEQGGERVRVKKKRTIQPSKDSCRKLFLIRLGTDRMSEAPSSCSAVGAPDGGLGRHEPADTASAGEQEPPPANSIRPMGKEAIRRIVTGQAILDLTSCVKELLDNSLDAGSRNINSKFMGGRAIPNSDGCKNKSTT
jgi:hypothetical protein